MLAFAQIRMYEEKTFYGKNKHPWRFIFIKKSVFYLKYKEKNMSNITFKALKREKAGKGAARACRREGRVPAVIYGGKKDPVMISLDPVELKKALDLPDLFTSEVVLDIEGKTQKVKCQDIQFHPVTDMPIHVDFLR